MRHSTTSREFFENKYRQNRDPWSFADSPYERERYDVILHALKGDRYAEAFEPGCSVGVLTQALAGHCDRLQALDISPTAVARARRRCRRNPNVRIQCGALPETIPDETLVLVIFSEIGYYFERHELRKILQRLSDQLNPGGALIAVHWLGASSDHRLSGDEVHGIIRENNQLTLDEAHRYPHFRLDRMVRR